MVPENKQISSFKLKNAFLLQQCYSFKDTLVPLPQVSPSLLTDTQRPTGELGGKKGAQGTPGALQGRAQCERHQAGGLEHRRQSALTRQGGGCRHRGKRLDLSGKGRTELRTRDSARFLESYRASRAGSTPREMNAFYFYAKHYSLTKLLISISDVSRLV